MGTPIEITPKTPTADAVTSHLRKLLRERHSKPHGNGPEWVYLEEVRNEAGFAASRTLDAMALHLWTSRGNELHGFEIKASRGDWLRELKDPSKADGFFKRCDRFWLVCALGVAKPEEVPATWGILSPDSKGSTLRIVRQAPLNKEADRVITRSFLACLLKSAGAALTLTPDQQAIKEAREAGRADGIEIGKRSSGNWEKLFQDQQKIVERAQTLEFDFAQTFGLSLYEWRSQSSEEHRKKVVSAMKAVMSESAAVDRAQMTVKRAKNDLERIAQQILSQASCLSLDEI